MPDPLSSSGWSLVAMRVTVATRVSRSVPIKIPDTQTNWYRVTEPYNRFSSIKSTIHAIMCNYHLNMFSVSNAGK